MTRRALVQLHRALKQAERHWELHPLEYARWTGPQVHYLSSTNPRKLLRLGNGGGKSWVALADVEYRARKAHPFRPDWNARPGPQHQWILTYSWAQAVPLMRIFKGFQDEQFIRSQPNWTDAKGWGKDSPTIVYRDGSTVTWRTMKQPILTRTAAALDHVLIDEPSTSENYRELERRVFRRGGDLSLALTPVNAPAPLDWLREMASAGLIEDIHYPMTEELFRFEDGSLRKLITGRKCDAKWIEEQATGVLPQFRDIVLHGGWDLLVVDGVFSETFSRSKHVSRKVPKGKVFLSLGNDHGTSGFSETAVLVAVDESTTYPTVYVLDLYEAPANTPSDEDARQILAMLKRHGLTWESLDFATGDIPHYGGSKNKVGRKSNADLAAEIARELRLGRHRALVPPIRTAKSGEGAGPRGSVYRGLTWLHKALLRPGQLNIHPRCESLIQSFERYQGGSRDPHGHLMDALRYALDRWIRRGQQRARNSAPSIEV